MAERENPDLVILDMYDAKTKRVLGLGKVRRTSPVRLAGVIMITANEGSRHKAYAETLGVERHQLQAVCDG